MRWIICMLLGLVVPIAESTEKIVYLVSPPRSLSVAFMRMMQARGDFEIFHEPFHCPWCFKANTEYAAIAYPNKVAPTYEEVKQSILDAAELRPVFVKDVSFDCEDFLLNDPDFVQNSNMHFVFLVRNPHHSIISWYKKCRFCPPRLNYLLGYEPFYRIFEKVKRDSRNKLNVVFSEDLLGDPKNAISRLCDSLEIPYIPEALQWQVLGRDFDYEKHWHDYRTKEEAQIWFGEAMSSSGFGKPSQYQVDENGNPTFEEIANPEHKNEYMECYEHNLKYFEMLLNDPDFQALRGKQS